MTWSPPKERSTTLLNAVRVLRIFARLVELKRSLEAASPDPGLNFWNIQYGGLMNLSVIEWCKLFGGDKNNDLHWKNVYANSIDDFRSRMIKASGVSPSVWTAYHSHLKSWRDQEFAHQDIDARPRENYPHFDIALAVARFYHAELIAELDDLKVSSLPKDLDQWRKRYREEFDLAAPIALASTTHLARR